MAEAIESIINNKHSHHQQHLDVHLEQLKQKLMAKTKHHSRYTKCFARKIKNRTLIVNQKHFYRQLSNCLSKDNEKIPGKQHLTEYWTSCGRTQKNMTKMCLD